MADLKIGQTARICRVNGDDSASLRILEMGITPGTQVAMLAVAPLGDPIEFRVRGYRLSLRRAEAARVEVNPEEP